ncbi:14747_t:CDS:2 [Rhizophagus irregularis]|nr:14747_t:CDS:2 [Rhizophagus irregularis]
MADGLCKTAHLDESDNNKIFWRNITIKSKRIYENINQLKYKADWLVLNVSRSYRFQDDISSLNNNLTAYILKNYLEILPKFTMLNQRNLELYESSKCCRCNVTIETWIHVWICKENDLTIKQIINEADKLKGKSFLIFNGRIFHETVKGIMPEFTFGMNDVKMLSIGKKRKFWIFSGHSFACLEFVQLYSGQFQNIFRTHCLYRDVEMSTDDLKLLQQVTDKSNFNFHSNNQTLKEANMRLHNPVPKDLQVYKPHLQKSLEQLVNGANLQAKLRRSQNETSQTSS